MFVYHFDHSQLAIESPLSSQLLRPFVRESLVARRQTTRVHTAVNSFRDTLVGPLRALDISISSWSTTLQASSF